MQQTKFNLEGRRAIITGGAMGIGKAIATRFLHSGAKVMIWDVDKQMDATVKELSSLGEIAAQHVDVTNFDALSAAAQAVTDKWGGIDILCSNAGIAGPTHSLWEYPIDEWLQIQNINVNGVFYCSKAVVPHMIAGGYGRIINTASIAGKEGNPNASAYSTSKAAVIGMTKSLGKELAKHNITVNCITPVTADTRILDQVSEEFVNFMLSKIPRGRFITVDEIAGTVTWMASEENGFTTGAIYDLSGGRATY